jgi:hypothetical protein
VGKEDAISLQKSGGIIRSCGPLLMNGETAAGETSRYSFTVKIIGTATIRHYYS